MERVTIFKKQLRDKGYSVATNWQAPQGGNTLEHCTISKDGKWSSAIFHIYEGGNGFSLYIEDDSNSMSDGIKAIEQAVFGEEMEEVSHG